MPYDACCGPVLRAERLPATAEELMRSRYTAIVVGDPEHLWRTWHPRTRPAAVDLDPGLTWTGLRILDTVDGGPGDASGEVEFAATFAGGELHERSRFQRRGGRWFYLDGDTR